jgi:hypothetical protein
VDSPHQQHEPNSIPDVGITTGGKYPYLNGLDGTAASGKHGVHKYHAGFVLDAGREFGVEQLLYPPQDAPILVRNTAAFNNAQGC